MRWSLSLLCLLLGCLSACQLQRMGAPMALEIAPGDSEVADGLIAGGLQDGRDAGVAPNQALAFEPSRWDGTRTASKDGKLAEQQAEAASPATGERMRIYQGSITVEVARRDDVQAQFLEKVGSWGGYLSQQEDNQLTVRVPAARFDEAFAWLHGIGRVRSESKQATDVTDQYLDLGIRLDNAKKSRERLLALLAKADKVEDILKIEEQLRRLTEEIERFEGQLKRLQDQVALATITARFVAPAAAPDRPGGRPSRFPWIRAIGAERMLEGF